LVFVCTAVLSASGQVRFGAGVQGATSISSFAKPASDYFSLGYGGGVHVDVDLTPAIGLRLSGDYHAFSSQKDKLKSVFVVTDENGNPVDFSVSGGTISIVGVTLDGIGRIRTASAVTPYGLAGVGAQIGKSSDVSISGHDQTV
jgi:opacity protein-like surface antigen